MENPTFNYITPNQRYAIMYTIGTGVMEDPNLAQGYICQSNDIRELQLMCDKLFFAFNRDEDIISSWVNHHFKVWEITQPTASTTASHSH